MARGNNIKGIVIEIGADTKPLEKALEGVKKKSNDIQDELRQVDRLLKLDPKNTTLLEQKQKLLAEAVSNTSDKLETLKDAERQVQAQFAKGEIGEEQYRAVQREVLATKQNLESLEKQLKETNSKWKDTGTNLDKAGSKMKDIGGKMTATVTAPIVGGAIAAVEGTKELRQELAKLENNAETAGANIDVTKNALRDLNAISDDSGANVEALSNMLQAGFKDSNLSNLVNELSGAVLKFPDTLKIEGLADGLQETLATGAAVGPFSELLERMGVDLDVFNEGLANASKTGQEHNYVLQELSKLGLADVNESYRKNNEEMIKSANAQNDLKNSTAELGEKLEPILTKATELVVKLLDGFNNLSPGTQTFIGIVIALLAALGPVLMIIGQMSVGIGALITTFGAGGAAAGVLGTAFTFLTGPIGIAIAIIGGLIGIGVALYKNWDTIKEKAGALKEKLKDMFNFEWKLPKIKLPHFNIQGQFSLNPPSIPSFGVEWYDKGGIFNSPSIIGVGEKRPEFVGALDDLRYLIRDELNKQGDSNYNIVVNNPKPEPTSDSVRKTLLKHSYGI